MKPCWTMMSHCLPTIRTFREEGKSEGPVSRIQGITASSGSALRPWLLHLCNRRALACLPRLFSMPSVYIKTYGCQMNERDSEAVAAQLVAKGYSLRDSEHTADVILLNTCSVR